MSSASHQVPLVAVVSAGWPHESWPELPSANWFRWHTIPANELKHQAREIWLCDAVAAVVLVGPQRAFAQAIELLHLLRDTGPPIVIAIVHPPAPHTERLLRQTGAIYLSGSEVQQRLLDLLHEMLCGPGVR